MGHGIGPFFCDPSVYQQGINRVSTLGVDSMLTLPRPISKNEKDIYIVELTM